MSQFVHTRHKITRIIANWEGNMKNTFNPLQRLHFYAAIFIAPLLITLTISGIGYLFFPEVENNIYKNEFFGDSDVKTHQTLNNAVH